MKVCKRIFKGFVLYMVVVSMLLPNVVGATEGPTIVNGVSGSSGGGATANDRVAASISVARGARASELDSNQLDGRFLTMMGIYLSNFFVPFVTEFGGETGEVVTKRVKEEMEKGLQQGLNVEKGMSEAIVGTIMGLVTSTAQEVYFGTEVGGQVKGLKAEYNKGVNISELGGDEEGTVVTVVAFLEAILGGAVVDGGLKNIVLYWVDDSGNRRVVFKQEYEGGKAKISTSMMGYLLSATELNYQNGQGNALTTHRNTKETQDNVIFGYSTEAKMYVDCFGDLLAGYGNKNLIILPGCMNAYNWWVDGLEASKGECVNLVSLFGMSRIYDGAKGKKGATKGVIEENESIGYYRDDTGKQVYKFKFRAGSSPKNLVNIDYYRLGLNRGTGDKNIYIGKAGWLNALFSTGDTLKGFSEKVKKELVTESVGKVKKADIRVRYPSLERYIFKDLELAKKINGGYIVDIGYSSNGVSVEIKDNSKNGVVSSSSTVSKSVKQMKEEMAKELGVSNTGGFIPIQEVSKKQEDAKKNKEEKKNEGFLPTKENLDKLKGLQNNGVIKQEVKTSKVKKDVSFGVSESIWLLMDKVVGVSEVKASPKKSVYECKDYKELVEYASGNKNLKKYKLEIGWTQSQVESMLKIAKSKGKLEKIKGALKAHYVNTAKVVDGFTLKQLEDTLKGLQSDNLAQYGVGKKEQKTPSVYDSNGGIGKTVNYTLSQLQLITGSKYIHMGNFHLSGIDSNFLDYVGTMCQLVLGYKDAAVAKGYSVGSGEAAQGTQSKVEGGSNKEVSVQGKKQTQICIDAFPIIDNIGEFIQKGDYSAVKFPSSLENGLFGVSVKKLPNDLMLKDDYSRVISTCTSSTFQGQLMGIYLAYALAFGNTENPDDLFPVEVDGTYKCKVNFGYNTGAMPGIGDEASSLAQQLGELATQGTVDSRKEEMMNWLYYLLHPIKGAKYIARWAKTKLVAIIVSTHEDMVGRSSSNASSGSTRYLGFSGYVTIPDLEDVKFTSEIIKSYKDLTVYLIIIIMLVLIFSILLGRVGVQKGVMLIAFYAVLLYIPPYVVQGVVNTSNSISDGMYARKFKYWSLLQHQGYLKEIESVVGSGDRDGYLNVVLKKQTENLDDNFASTKVKWTGVKKVDVTKDAESELVKGLMDSPAVRFIVQGALQKALSGESFLARERALYLYRDYVDIATYRSAGSRTEGWYNTKSSSDKVDSKDSNLKITVDDFQKGSIRSNLWWRVDRRNEGDKEYSIRYGKDKGFLVDSADVEINNTAVSYLMDSGMGVRVLDANKGLFAEKTKGVGNESNASYYQGYGLPRSVYQVTLPKLKGGVMDGKWVSDESTYVKKDLGAFYYGLYTESPYYYFGFNFKDQEGSKDYGGVSEVDNVSQLVTMFTTDNQSYFYNYKPSSGDGYGEMRDYLNMRGLFTYVIPYLRESNTGVLEYARLYGVKPYSGVRVKWSEGEVANKPSSDGDSEYRFKWWHNYNLECLFNTYSGWVDLMSGCRYAKSETIRVGGKRYVVSDPLDPATYVELNQNGVVVGGRPMVFSRSEMKYYGLELTDLTSVEAKIIQVGDRVYKELYGLVNYGNFDDEVLVSAASMIATFEFNKAFSERRVFGESNTLYPQGYELKAFSYDAYLRLMLAESTGESLDSVDSKGSESQVELTDHREVNSFYMRVVERSSILTGFGFLVLDVLVCYVLPCMKFFLLVIIMLFGVLLVFASALRLEKVLTVGWSGFIKPLLWYLGYTLLLSLAVSLFMSNGREGVTGSLSLTMSLGDPMMVVVVMVAINGVILWCYFKILLGMYREFQNYFKEVSRYIGDSVGKIGRVALGSMGLVGAGVGAGVMMRGQNGKVQGVSRDGQVVRGRGKRVKGVFGKAGRSSKDYNARIRGERVGTGASKLRGWEKRGQQAKLGYERRQNYYDAQVQALKRRGKDSFLFGKLASAAGIAKYKTLGVLNRGRYQVSKGYVGVGKAQRKMRNSVRESKLGRVLKIDDKSRLGRARAKRELLRNEKNYRSGKIVKMREQKAGVSVEPKARMAEAESRDIVERVKATKEARAVNRMVAIKIAKQKKAKKRKAHARGKVAKGKRKRSKKKKK